MGSSTRGTARAGRPNYRVSGEGIHFHTSLMAREGESVSQIEVEVHRLLDGDAFARAHPQAAHHLREAFTLVWDGNSTDQVISEVGDHLRKAIMDVTTDIVGAEAVGTQERPIERLTTWLAARPDLSEREVAVLHHLIDLARVVLRLDHRLNHVRDEKDDGVSRPSWEETRRAAFTTAFACYELSRGASNTSSGLPGQPCDAEVRTRTSCEPASRVDADRRVSHAACK